MTCLSRPLPKRRVASLFGFAIAIVPQVSPALTVEDVPNPRQAYGGWVTDMANVIDDNTEAKLDRLISTLEAQNGSEIAIVTMKETAPSPTPKAFATELFNHWGIGKQGIDNGVLFLVSVGDRRVEIETGSGLAQILPDAEVKRILDMAIIPDLKRDDFDGGIWAGTRAIVSSLETVGFQEQVIDGDRQEKTEQYWRLYVLLLLLSGGIGIGAVIIARMNINSSGGDCDCGSGGHSSSGSIGGGTGSFGGGSSNGGGAGGDF